MMTKPDEHIRVWSVDPLEKIFRGSEPPEDSLQVVELEAARGEVVSAQVALRTVGVACHGFGVDAVTLAPLRRVGAVHGEPGIPVQRRWVGYAFVGKPAWGVDPERLEGTAPGLYPDPLYDLYETHGVPHHLNPDHSIALAKDRTQALWLTARVPHDATPGWYEGEAHIRISFYGDDLRVPIRLNVHVATLPERATCSVENWFALVQVVRQHECGWWTPQFWRLVKAYLQNLADHRQTHLVVPMFELLGVTAAGTNGRRLGWGRFDRFVNLALDAGITTLVGNHLATYTYHLGDDRIQCGIHAFRRDGKDVRRELLRPGTPEAEAWFAWFLPRLRAHLRERGWLEHWWQHIRDEPTGLEREYHSIYEAIKRHAPEFRTIDALHGPIVPACDCWVPQLNAWGSDQAFFRARQQAGDQVWTYVCCTPTGRFANRFIDQRTVLPRLIFWIMARYGATGYLHWGYNWADVAVPETDTTWFMPAQGPTQSGDVAVVYPGPQGPRDSIRWEMQREGVQDYELLRLLAERDPVAAEKIAGRLVMGFDDYSTDMADFRAARHDLLELLDESHDRNAGQGQDRKRGNES